MKTKKIMTDMEVDKKVRLIYTQFDRKRKLTDRQVETCKRNLAMLFSTMFLLKHHIVWISKEM